MSVKTELSQNLAQDRQEASPLDTAKLVAAALLLLGALFAYYRYDVELSAIVRNLGMAAAVAIALGLAAWTRIGRAFLGFLGDARMELRKVVWPTRAETTQTTILIFVFVVIVGILLWMMDTFFAFVIRWLFGH